MKFMVIAGPCVIESRENVFLIAEKLNKVMKKYIHMDFVFKASFDKANRTSGESYRGPGIEEGLKILQEVKNIYNVKICTDIHQPWQAEQIAQVADIIQIPAFLCRQTDLLVAAGETGKIINVKKGQFLAPWDMEYVIDKIIKTGNTNVLLCERGTSFGYNTLVVDMTSILEMKKFGYPVIFDATHSVQRPGGNGKSSGGKREYAEYLAKAAVAIGSDGVFLEVHPNPDEAKSDGANSIRLNEFDRIIGELDKIHQIISE